MKKEIQDLGLIAPPEFWNSDEATLLQMTGGCGPGKFGDVLVPDTFYGLSMEPACRIHDFEYGLGGTEEDKKEADWNFLRNMVLIITQKSRFKFIRILRLQRAMKYYTAVAEGGNGSFYKAA